MLHNDSPENDCAHLLNADAAVQHFATWTALWHSEEPSTATDDDLLLLLHLANFTLWHLEDRARDPHASDAVVAGLKRGIDKANQTRNDLVEQFDAYLLQALAPYRRPDEGAPLHSETPGLMLDRLSILALKMFHTAEQARRTDVLQSHIDRNRQRLAVLERQSHDLKNCLTVLWREVCQGSRAYRQYRQLKMYNDPQLNPVLYSARTTDITGGA